MKKIMISAIMAAAAIGASAQSLTANTYGEVGYGTASLSVNGSPLTTGVTRVVVGKEFTPNFAVEGHASAGTDTVAHAMKLDSAFGAFVKAKYNVTPQAEVFARAGYNRVNGTMGGMTGHESGGAYAVGANYALTKTSAIGVDYTQLYSKDATRLSTTMVSYRLKF